MKNKILSIILMAVFFFTGSVQNVSAYINEDWRYDEDMYEKYWEEKEREESERKQQAMYDELAKRREEQAIAEMEKQAEQEKKNAAYDGAYVDFDDNERYLPTWYDDDNKDIFTHDRITISGNYIIIKPETKIGNKLKNELKACKKDSRAFKYTITNKKNTIKMTHSSFKSLTAYIKAMFQSTCDKVIGIEQNGVIKNIEFDTADYSMNIYVTDDIASEYSYGMAALKENYLEDVLYYAKMYGLFFGAEDPDEIQIKVLDVYTEEVIFNNFPAYM